MNKEFVPTTLWRYVSEMLFEGMEFGPYDQAERKAREAYELYEDGQMAQALTELDSALEINPANSAWHFNKGLTLDAIGRFDEAISEYETALQLSPDDLEMLNSLAVDYTRKGHYDRALSTFEYVQQLDPAFEPAYCNRIITYTEMGQHDVAEQMFYLAQQIAPDCALCYYNIGNSLFARAQYKKAIHCWLRTAELEPTHPQINYRIAQAFWSDGDPTAARKYFLAELRGNPGDIDVIMDFALFLLDFGDIDAAKEKFNRILELNPDYALALFYLGEVTWDQGRLDEAVVLFEDALSKEVTLPGPHYRMAQYALAGDQTQEAQIHLLAELELEVESASTLVSMGSMFLKLGDLDHASHCLLRAMDMDTSNVDARYYLGVVAANRGHYREAAEYFCRALSLDDGHRGALKDSALTYLALGQADKAAAQTARARALQPDDHELRLLDYSIRLIRFADRLGRGVAHLDPRRLFLKWRR